MESSTVEAGAPAAAVPDDRCRPPPQGSGALLDEEFAAAAPYPCSSCAAFHGNESGFCSACSETWLPPDVAARAARLQRRAYLALITVIMSYFETDDRFVVSIFCGSTTLIVFFWFLCKSVATAAPEWITALVALVSLVAYFIPAIRRTVVLVEDVDAISSLFDRASMQHLEGVSDADMGPAERKHAGGLLQPTDDLRQLYAMARARIDSFELQVVEHLARAGRSPTERSRETRGPKLKGLLRAREKISMDYQGKNQNII